MSEDVDKAHSRTPLQERLEAYYRLTAAPDVHVKIGDFTPITDGWETEVYAFTATLRHQVEPLILRMYPGDEDGAKCEREYKALLFLMQHSSGYPVPFVSRHETDTKWLGKPFIIMQKIDGQPLGHVMREETERQPELLTRFVQLFVDLHRIDYRAFVDDSAEVEGSNALAALLARWREAIIDASGQTWAAPVLDWLDAHMGEVSAPQLAILHNDFHPNNVLITPDDQLYVIDWSGFAVGDYRRDLAWTLLLISTSGFRQLRDPILSEYERLAGYSVENIEYFDVLAVLRRLFDFAVSLGSGAESAGMRPETVVLMRQQHAHFRQVYEIMQSRSGLRLPEIEQLLDSLMEK